MTWMSVGGNIYLTESGKSSGETDSIIWWVMYHRVAQLEYIQPLINRGSNTKEDEKKILQIVRIV